MEKLLCVKQFRESSINCLRYKIIKTRNLEDFLRATEIGKVLNADNLRDFAKLQGWEIEIT